MKSKEALTRQCKYLFDEFLTNNKKYKTLAHFRRSPGGYLVMLKIFENYFSDKDIHVEELIRLIPITPSEIFIKEFREWLTDLVLI